MLISCCCCIGYRRRGGRRRHTWYSRPHLGRSIASRSLICSSTGIDMAARAMEVAVGAVVQAGRAGDVLGACIEIPGMVIRNRVDINIGLAQRPSLMTNREIERTVPSKTSGRHSIKHKYNKTALQGCSSSPASETRHFLLQSVPSRARLESATSYWH